MTISISCPTVVIAEVISTEGGAVTLGMLTMDGSTTHEFEEAATFTDEDKAREFLYHLAGVQRHEYYSTFKIVEVVDGENWVEY
jgi:hypothetical protein